MGQDALSFLPLFADRSSAGTKEFLHKCAAVFGKNTARDIKSMIKIEAVTNAKVGFDGAESFVASPINQASDAGIDERPGTHRAWFDRGVNGCTRKAIIPYAKGGGPQSENFGMSSRIGVNDSTVRFGREDPPFHIENDGTDRNLADLGCLACDPNGTPHPFFVLL